MTNDPIGKLKPPATALTAARGQLYRAIVACPPAGANSAYDERVVFFEVPRGHASPGAHLEDLLARIWCLDTAG